MTERRISPHPVIAQLQCHSLTNLVQTEIERMILEGELPSGAKLTEATLAEPGTSGVGEGYQLTALQRLFLFTRSDTIYAGSNQIQRNIIGERALGLPPEPKPAPKP